LARDWAWLGSTWLRIGLVWWAWLSICSLPVHGLGNSGPTQFLQALATLRFLLFVAALEHTVLAATETRRWLARVLTVATLYIAVQSLWQFATGRNFF